jgi:hypothetical protein
MSHSPEPWNATNEETSDYIKFLGIKDSQGETVLGSIVGVYESQDPGVSDENVRRIVACVNACKGFTTEQLEAAAKGEALCIIGNSKELCEIIQNAPDEGFIAYQSSPQYFTDGSSPGEKPTVGPLGDIAREILAAGR